MFAEAFRKNPQVCVHVCVGMFLCQTPTIGTSYASARIYDHSFSCNRANFHFLSPSGSRVADASIQNRWLNSKEWNSPLFTLIIFIYIHFTQTSTGFIYQCDWSCQHRDLLVKPAGVKKTKRSNKIKLTIWQTPLLITGNQWRFSLWSKVSAEPFQSK